MRPGTDAIVMMWPDPRARIDGSTARLHRRGPLTLTACTLSHSCPGVSWQRAACWDPVMPALFTSTSIRPNRSSTAAMAAATSDSSVTSQRRASAAAPTRSAAWMSRAATVNPSATSRAQVASPIPDPPPVTTTTPGGAAAPVTAGPADVRRVELSRPQQAELDEMFRVEEQFVQLGHVVHGEALGPPDQVVDVLEGILGAVPHVMRAEDLARVRVDDQLEPAGQHRPGEGVEHRSLGGREGECLRVGVVGRHLDLDDVAVLRPGLGLGQAAPGHLVGGVQEVGILGEVELVVLAHDVAGGADPALARLEHLHRRGEEVARRR